MVERVVPLYLQGDRFLSEYSLYGADVGLSTEADTDYVGDFVEVEGWVLRFQIYDKPADVWRKLAVPSLIRR